MSRHLRLYVTIFAVFGLIATGCGSGSSAGLTPSPKPNLDPPALLKDIRPGTGNGVVYSEEFAAFGGHLYFTADDGVHGQELWRTDGTSAGTAMVKDVASDGSRQTRKKP